MNKSAEFLIKYVKMQVNIVYKFVKIVSDLLKQKDRSM